MFDAIQDSSAAGRPPDTAHLPGDLRRLCDRYDGLLSGSTLLDDDACGQLKAMARIYDLDTERPPLAVWKDLRAVLVRQSPSGEADRLPPAPALTVMVVEDDPVVAADLVETLMGAGHGVAGPFRDAETALASAGLMRIDLALVDINLADKRSGVDLAEALKAAWDVPVMFLSGDVTAAARHAELAAALVIKPFRGAEVLQAIDRAVARGTVLG